MLTRMKAVVLWPLLFFMMALALATALGGCSDSKLIPPPVRGELTITPQVLPFEGGTVQLDWQTTPASGYVVGEAKTSEATARFDTTGAEIALQASASGTSQTFTLMHPAQKLAVTSASVAIRPQWQMPAPVALDTSSTVTDSITSRAGALVVAGETAAAQAGTALGGRDVFVYRFAAKGRLQSQHQIGTSADDRMLGLRESAQGVHVLLQSGAGGTSGTFSHTVIDESGGLQSSPVSCLASPAANASHVLDWQVLQGGSFLFLALGSGGTASSSAASTSEPQLQLVHCNASRELVKSASRPAASKIDIAKLVMGSTPQQALALVTTSSDLGAGSSPYPQPQLLRVDLTTGAWEAKRLASPQGHRFLAGVLIDTTVQIVGSSASSEQWLMQASLQGGFSGKTALFDGQAKPACCTAFKPARGARPGSWIVGSSPATNSQEPPELTAMQLPDLEPVGTIAISDTTFAALRLVSTAVDASGDFFTVTEATRSDTTRWLRIEQFNELGQSRVPRTSE